ncbi:family 43 glycosylhydrolase [Paenibacillus spongiae]|uniref:Family 43 glycosylhydrolase n=1 Tax=Paenibacillus spongiae TaxID=2909671 RepID=A0ABY5S132_9BACL|nr:family 43 glycosylhydrolase [Paenibacillus spongiae]UVI27566.1 family 43 glycosylhydrolase [Paenibacillus spongiae]
MYFSKHNGHDGIAMWEIEIETGKLIGEATSLWRGYEDRQCEAPHLYAINGMYYLITAEGGTWRGHMVTIARSKLITGPYESCPHNPILTHRCLIGHPVQTVGHGDLVQAHDGSWWMVFLATRTVGYLFHHLGRETFLAPVTWSEDGWPIVNNGEPIETQMAADSLPPHPWPAAPIRDDFASASFGLQWNFLRGYPDDRISLVITITSSWPIFGFRRSKTFYMKWEPEEMLLKTLLFGVNISGV